ncbi:hypothetical protein D3874_00160 [Oleomonas cavernae]|uniref:5'-3' exonuclease domain-containing protein n=1 Tax=Oleomonas cavernae TaxID=2320859 RepID=A0A418WUP5_9PROT|nr:hypothetical protein D3874_00160 [Oleomonas cavernae]
MAGHDHSLHRQGSLCLAEPLGVRLRPLHQRQPRRRLGARQVRHRAGPDPGLPGPGGRQDGQHSRVKGIGPVTAVKLLREFKSLQGILESRSIQKVARQVMRDREMALVSQALVQFKTDVSIGLSWADLRAGDGVGRDE